MVNPPVPQPRNFAVAEVETGGYLNSLRDALNFLLAVPIGQFYQGVAQSIPNAVWTSAALDTTDRDSYGGHSNSTNNSRYTAVVPDLYEFTGAAGFASNATGYRAGAWAKNGTLLSAPGGTTLINATNGNVTSFSVPTLQVFLNVGDYVELQVYQNSGGALNTATGQYACLMGVKWIHT